MWELAGPLGRTLKNGAANLIFWLWALGRTLKNDAADIIFSCGSWFTLGRALKNDAANIIFSRESAAQQPRFWRPPSAHQFLIGRTMSFGISWPNSGSGPFQLPVALFSYVARRTLKNYATNITFSCGSWPAPRRACLKITLRTSFSYVGAGWATRART